MPNLERIGVHEVLPAMDSRFGTQLHAAHLALTHAYPELSNRVDITLDRTRSHAQYWPTYGNADLGSITIGSSLDDYEWYVSTGLLDRYTRLIELLASHGLAVRPAFLKTFGYIHEFGHAQDYEKQLEADRAAGRTRAQTNDQLYERRARVSELPGGWGFEVIEEWDNYRDDTSGYRDRCNAAGFTEAQVRERIVGRLRGYANLPEEYSADTFALNFMNRHLGLLAV